MNAERERAAPKEPAKPRMRRRGLNPLAGRPEQKASFKALTGLLNRVATVGSNHPGCDILIVTRSVVDKKPGFKYSTCPAAAAATRAAG